MSPARSSDGPPSIPHARSARTPGASAPPAATATRDPTTTHPTPPDPPAAPSPRPATRRPTGTPADPSTASACTPLSTRNPFIYREFWSSERTEPPLRDVTFSAGSRLIRPRDFISCDLDGAVCLAKGKEFLSGRTAFCNEQGE